MDVNAADLLLDHFDKYLGKGEGSWKWGEGRETHFYVFLFACPFAADSHVLVTCGLSAHQFAMADSPEKKIRREFLICADKSSDPKALAALLIAVGIDALNAHAVHAVGSVMLGDGPVLSGGNAAFENLYVATPLGFPYGFATCEQLSPPVEIVQIVPISEKEMKFVMANGGHVLEENLMANLSNLLRFDRRKECA